MSLEILLSHSRSFRVTENGTIRKVGYGFLFAFHSNHGRIFRRFDTIHERGRHSHPAGHRTTTRVHYAASLGCSREAKKTDNGKAVIRRATYVLSADTKNTRGHVIVTFEGLTGRGGAPIGAGGP